MAAVPCRAAARGRRDRPRPARSRARRSSARRRSRSPDDRRWRPSRRGRCSISSASSALPSAPAEMQAAHGGRDRGHDDRASGRLLEIDSERGRRARCGPARRSRRRGRRSRSARRIAPRPGSPRPARSRRPSDRRRARARPRRSRRGRSAAAGVALRAMRRTRTRSPTPKRGAAAGSRGSRCAAPRWSVREPDHCDRERRAVTRASAPSTSSCVSMPANTDGARAPTASARSRTAEVGGRRHRPDHRARVAGRDPRPDVRRRA